MRGGESGRDEVGVRQITRTMLYWCYSIIHPSYHAVTLKGHHPHGAHIDVWACDISRVCMCVCTRAAVWEFPSLHPDEPSTHLCLVLSLPSRLFLSVRPRCDSMFPISERIGTLGGRKKKVREGARQSCHSGLGICLFSIGVRRCWWEKSTVYQMSSLHIARAVWALTRTARQYHRDNSSSQKDSL